ncbi:MAG: DUF1285 domain-containing protein [Pseudomonadota bacterium]
MADLDSKRHSKHEDLRPKRPHLADLMAKGGGLSGFEWPEQCGDFEMRIARNGVWFYRGSPIGRTQLCQLFATCLQRDQAGEYWLVTPAERGRVEVDDAPFFCVELENGVSVDGVKWLRFRTSLEFWVEANADHPIEVKLAEDQTPRPYIHVRDGLWALIARPVFYHLIDLGQVKTLDDGREWMHVESHGIEFPIAPL